RGRAQLPREARPHRTAWTARLLRLGARPRGSRDLGAAGTLAVRLLVLFCLLAAPAAGQVPGFTAARWPQQQETERLFLSVPSADSARAHVRALTTQPHLSGTPGAEATAEWLVDWLHGHGFETRIDAYDIWLPQP